MIGKLALFEIHDALGRRPPRRVEVPSTATVAEPVEARPHEIDAGGEGFIGTPD